MLSLGNGRTLELIAKARTPEKGGKKIQSALFMENCSLFWTENKDLSRAFGCFFSLSRAKRSAECGTLSSI